MIVPSTLPLEGKVALVTGASRGIGRAVALAFAGSGADIVPAARSEIHLESVAAEARALGRRASPVTCDVTDANQIAACVEGAVAAFGRIDILVNNAGGAGFIAPVLDTRDEWWRTAIDLNLNSVFAFCKAVGRHMLKNGRGSVINVASTAGLHATPNRAFYGAAKAAVIHLSRTLAAEWGKSGVRVNALCPGWVKTDLTRPLWANNSAASATIGNVPLGRWGDPSDIAPAAVWLASDASAYVSGAVVTVDGGQTA